MEDKIDNTRHFGHDLLCDFVMPIYLSKAAVGYVVDKKTKKSYHNKEYKLLKKIINR